MITTPDDPLFDENFKPCRKENCSIDRIHAAHDKPIVRGRALRCCPICGGKITKIKWRRAFCADVKCSWRVNQVAEE